MAVPMREPRDEPRRLTILGSTGSVGCNTIDLIERDPGAYLIEALTANRNVELLQIIQGGLIIEREHRPW